MHTILRWCFIFSSVALVSACGKPDSPEQQIARFIAKGEEVAEQRDLLKIKDLVSDNYTDEHKRNKREIVQIATAYIWRHKHIYVYTQTRDLTIIKANHANLKLFVALANLPIASPVALQEVRARLYRFDLNLVKQDDAWLIQGLKWWPATQEDFF